jgi:putative membrane protein
MLSPSDHQRIADAVARVEAATSGEILCVLARKVSEYREVPMAWAAFAAMALPPLAVAAGLHPWGLFLTGDDWAAASEAFGDISIPFILMSYGVMQVAIFAIVAVALTVWPDLRLAMTPKGLKQTRVRRAAMQQLAAAKLSDAGGAVVIFASEAERMVAIVADEALHLKAGDAAWDAAVAAVLKGVRSHDPASGFIAGIDVCGAYLAEHFPANGEAHNALPDGLLEI